MIHYEWDLSCNAEIARKLITDSLDNLLKPFPFSFGNFKGIVNDEMPASDGSDCLIWEVSGMRGLPAAFCKIKLEPNGEQSYLSADIKLTWPLRYFKFGYKVVVPLILLMVSSWLIIALGMVVNKYDQYTPYFIPLFVGSAISLILRLGQTYGAEQMADLRRFVEEVFKDNIIK